MKSKHKNSDQTYASMLKTLNSGAAPPDESFLRRLRDESLREFSTALPEQGRVSSKGLKPEGIWRLRMRNKALRFTAAAMIVMAVVIGMHLLGGSLESSAYAQVVQALQSARTLKYTLITPTNVKAGQFVETRCIYKDPGKLYASTADEIVSVMDSIQGKGISLGHPLKQYVEFTYDNLPDHPGNDAFEAIARLRELPARANEVIEVQEINGCQAQGFRVIANDVTTTVWIDCDTRDLLRAEQAYVNTPGMNVVMEDFEFDVPVDDSLFSLTPPAGYTRKHLAADVARLGEQDFLELMRIWSKLTKAGTFPPTVHGLQLGKIAIEMRNQGLFHETWTEQQNTEFAQGMFKGLMFVASLPDTSNWRYAGEDVQLGSTDTPIFWYRPQGSQAYRVICGDLQVRECLPEDLPQ